MIGKIKTSWEQSHESQTKMKDEWLKYCDMVSTAAERSRRQRQEKFLWTYSIDEMVVNVRESRFSGMVFTVSKYQDCDQDSENFPRLFTMTVSTVH